MVRARELSALIDYLNVLDPKQKNVEVKTCATQSSETRGGMDEIKNYFPDLVQLFLELGVRGELQKEPGGEVRILGHGGLVVDNRAGRWYCFSEEVGGDVIDAFGWTTLGPALEPAR